MYGGPDGEIGASLRYLSQRYTMPNGQLIGLLTDIGTEELAHMEMVASIVHQLTRGLTEKQIEEQGFSEYYTDHGLGIWPQSAGGIPHDALTYASKGNAICDLNEDLAADGTTTKEQPVKTKRRKPLILLKFSAFSGCTSLTALQPYNGTGLLILFHVPLTKIIPILILYSSYCFLNMSVQFHTLANIIHYAAFMKAVEEIMKKWQD